LDSQVSAFSLSPSGLAPLLVRQTGGGLSERNPARKRDDSSRSPDHVTRAHALVPLRALSLPPPPNTLTHTHSLSHTMTAPLYCIWPCKLHIPQVGKTRWFLFVCLAGSRFEVAKTCALSTADLDPYRVSFVTASASLAQQYFFDVGRRTCAAAWRATGLGGCCFCCEAPETRMSHAGADPCVS
jgi:hypothetical protein